MCFLKNNELSEATPFTKKENENLYKYLDFENNQDFIDAMKGKVAPLDFVQLKDEEGRIVWDTETVKFLNETTPATVNPSLWRNSRLQSISGLFKVIDGVYQVRGVSLSSLLIIESDNGVIVCDTLKSVESAKAAMDLYYQHRPKKPVVAVIISQSHSDHFGGIQGVMEYAENPEIPIVVPENLAKEAISEYVFLGNIMKRRGQYQFGATLPAGPKGVVSQGIGPVGTNGKNSFKIPNFEITKEIQPLNLDGIDFQFLLTPNTEAPAEMHFYIENYKLIFASENVNRTMHQIYTVRGAKTRDTLEWVKAIENTIVKFCSNEVEALTMSHGWPIWGKENIIYHLRMQSDMYKYMHDQTIRLANHGYTMDEVAEMMELPAELDRYWGNRGYYGSLKHNVKGIYSFYLGYYSGHPSDLDVLIPRDAGRKYVEYMGGEENVIKLAKRDFDKGEYRWVAQVLKNIIMFNPDNKEARELLMLTYEQLAYQAESANWRNIYLTGAQELRTGIDKNNPPYDSSMLSYNIPLDQFFTFLSVNLNGPKAEKHRLNMRFIVYDERKRDKYDLELKNAVLRHKLSDSDIEVDFSVELDKLTLYKIGYGALTLEEALESKKINISGEVEKLKLFFSLLDEYDPLPNIVLPN